MPVRPKSEFSKLHERQAIALSLCRSLIGVAVATLIIVGSAAPHPVAAQTSTTASNPAQGQVERLRLLELFEWAARLTSRTLPQDPVLPPVVSLSDEQINKRVCPDSPNRCRRIAAAYGIENRDIIYRDSLDLSRLMDQSYVLHEFVHYLQHQDQREAVNASCRQIRLNERKAYRAQAAFLRHHGIHHPVGLELSRVRCPSDRLQMAQQDSDSTVR